MSAASERVVSDEEAAALLEQARPGEPRALDLAKLRISHGRLPMLELLHQNFAALFAASLGNLLKRDVQVSLQKIETQRCSDYFAALAVPACLDLVNIRSLSGPSLISIDPALVYQMVESYYGGSGRGQRDPERPLTPSELRFAQLVLKQ